jgi:hypothetical protein
VARSARRARAGLERLIEGQVLDDVWEAYENAVRAGKIQLPPDPAGDSDPHPGRYLNPHKKAARFCRILKHPGLLHWLRVLLEREPKTLQTIASHKGSQHEPRIREVIAEHKLQPQYFHARKGDVLIWHANLLHGGSMRRDLQLSRKAVVCHFFGKGAFVYHDLSAARSRQQYMGTCMLRDGSGGFRGVGRAGRTRE